MKTAKILVLGHTKVLSDTQIGMEIDSMIIVSSHKIFNIKIYSKVDRFYKTITICT